ncbi:MAG: 23S rRNA (pseudouridine(1915)-N(3))-methyltransferase RlmH [Vulcanimicrobiaceae bacterium]
MIALGKIREPYIAQAAADFRRRLRPYYKLEELELKASSGADPARAIQEESEHVLKRLDPGETMWLLHRLGTQLGSEQLAERLIALADAGTARLTIAIGGTYGASEALRARAQFVWSLSELTFLHEWARAIVLEQLYRAAKIARHEPYHH